MMHFFIKLQTLFHFQVSKTKCISNFFFFKLSSLLVLLLLILYYY